MAKRHYAMAALVGYIARKTREDIFRRTTVGRERAMARGVKFGRKPKLTPSQHLEVLARRQQGEEIGVLFALPSHCYASLNADCKGSEFWKIYIMKAHWYDKTQT